MIYNLQSMKILIDPAYLNPEPYHLLPRFLVLPVDRFVPSFLWGSRFWAGPFPCWALGPHGFDGLDLGFSYTYLFRPDLTIRQGVLERYRALRWPIRAFHGTFAGGPGFFLPTALDLSVDGERTRRGLINHIRVAAELGGKDTVLVLHPGLVRNGVREAIDTVVANLERCLPEAEARQVVLALENMPRSVGRTPYVGSDYRELEQILVRLPSGNLKVCMDLGHANTYGEVHARSNGRRDVEGYLRRFGYCREMIRALGTEIVYAHVHYNRSHVLSKKALPRGNPDEHMPLSHVPEPFWSAFRETLALLIRETSVCRTGVVNLELAPRRLFGRFRAMPMGCGLREQLSSVRLLREVLQACDPTPEG